MTERNEAHAVPFWQRKNLGEMTEGEWESLCDGCGRCCLEKLIADDTQEVYSLDVGCALLDTATGRCSDYQNRLSRDVGCVKFTPATVSRIDWMPPTCGYRRVLEGKPLEWWHPLVSGSTNSIHDAGISVAGRVIRPDQAGPREYHTIDWALRNVPDDQGSRWSKAMYGGVNASVPTPFGIDGHVDLDLMSEHCRWLLANGCRGLAILDSVGEVASIAVQERILMMTGLVARGIPASKLLTGVGPASVADGTRIAAHAAALGIRGVLINASATGKITPSDLLSKPVRQLIQALDPSLHIYLSLSVGSPSAIAGCLTALEATLVLQPGRLRGIRDESQGAIIARAALGRFGQSRFEVYAADDAALADLVQQGAGGLIGPSANLLSRLCADAMNPNQAMHTQPTIIAASKVLRSRSAALSIKPLLARHTRRSAWDRVRLPLRPLRQTERDALFAAFDATGIRLPPAA